MASGGFFTLLEAAAKFAAFKENMKFANEAILTRWASEVQKRAKDSIGVGRKDWPPLAPSTVEHKGHDLPLYETGELKESISGFVQMHGPEHGRAVVGTPLERGLFAETGTINEPPRPWLLPAALDTQKDIEKFAKLYIRTAWSSAGHGNEMLALLHALRIALHIVSDLYRGTVKRGIHQ
jgi:hypothetical protein